MLYRDLPFANPRFREWFEEQPTSAVAQIEAKAAEILNDATIAHAHPTGSHARLRALMLFCRDEFGYDFERKNQ